MPAKVNFIGIGAQKCASSWVHRVLAAHPQTCLSQPKELDYFSYFFGRGRDWYERHFQPGPEARITGDNSPSYFVHPLAPARCARYNPEMRIVLALRNPIDRAYSNHLHMIREGFLTGPDLSFEYGLARNEMYLEQSRYATHLRRWLGCFPREQIHVLLQEDLGEGAPQQATRLYRFLGLTESFQSREVDQRANDSSVAGAGPVASALKSGAGLFRQVGLGRLVTAMTANPGVRRLRAAGRVPLRDRVPPMQAATRDALRETLAPEVAELAVLLGGRPLPWPEFIVTATAH